MSIERKRIQEYEEKLASVGLSTNNFQSRGGKGGLKVSCITRENAYDTLLVSDELGNAVELISFMPSGVQLNISGPADGTQVTALLSIAGDILVGNRDDATYLSRIKEVVLLKSRTEKSMQRRLEL